MKRLCNVSLSELPARVTRPSYDRTKLTAGIVHIGLGNFHRAHQAWYLHRLMQLGLAQDWAIVGAGVQPYDVVQRRKLAAQDYLTTLIQLDPTGISAEVVGPMIDYIAVEQSNRALIERMAGADIRIVSLTVTEGGYYIDPSTKELDASHPDLIHDAENPATPRTAFGAIVAALKLRRERGVGPFTGLSCDNLLSNGAILRQTVVSLARLSDPNIADWIETNCSFPNSMVDCIVPATGPKEIALAREFGIEDAVPVTHERFRQWVIDDDFCAGRPDWDKVGAVFTNAVHDYETMKIRILNAGHQVLANAGELLSVKTIADCMAHPLIAGFFYKVEHQEIVPYVKPVPNMIPDTYLELISTRFANQAIFDTTRRVAFDGSSRHTGFLLPVLRDALAAGGSVEGLSLVEALWARMCAGTREDGTEIEPNDPLWDRLMETAKRAKSEPLVWLEMRQIYGDLVDQPRLANAFSKWLSLIWSQGVEATLEEYCGQTGAHAT